MKTNKQYHTYCALLPIVLILWLCTGTCKKYLDARPNLSFEEPSTLQDYQALLDDENMNVLMPFACDIASDFYYLPYARWNALSTADFRNDYVWGTSPANDQDWQYAYQDILRTNIVLDGLGKLTGGGDTRQVKGSAYFFRGYIYYQLANVFTIPYEAGKAQQAGLGLPLHLSADITAPTVRSTLAGTYGQIISDLKTAVTLLPVTPLVKTRPSKPAAYGALARVYLAMGDYQHAGLYADSCLQLYATLTDYNTLAAGSNIPFPLFNAEVIYHSAASGRGSVVSPSKAVTDSNLYQSYAAGDLRKVLFFKINSSHLPVFKGDYGGSTGDAFFGGIATDEMFLTRAECEARNGQASAAVTDLNTLLSKRYQNGSYAAYDTGMSADAALGLVLAERRKELAYRNGLRWADLRRLGQDSRFAVTLTRNLNGTVYTLPPNDKRYAFLVPISVIKISGIRQNER